MIRQKNIDPGSKLGVKEAFFNPLVPSGGVGARTYVGIPIIGVDKVQLIDLTLLVNTAASGGGTLGFDIYKSASNVAGSNAGTLVKACNTGVAAVGIYKTDLSNVAPIDPRGLLAATPNDFILQVSYVNSGTVNGGGLVVAILRYRPYGLKDL